MSIERKTYSQKIRKKFVAVCISVVCIRDEESSKSETDHRIVKGIV